MRMLLAALLALAACAPEPRGGFRVALTGGLTARERAEAERVGFEVQTTPGAREENADAPGPDGRPMVLPAATLRLAAARALVRGEPGLSLRVTSSTAGQDLLDYPEEWLALARLGREYAALRPVLSTGPGVPFSAGGVEARAWRWAGRDYRLFVNDGPAPLPIDEPSLSQGRALFEPRADAREVLVRCGERACLPPRRALWVEGRP